MTTSVFVLYMVPMIINPPFHHTEGAILNYIQNVVIKSGWGEYIKRDLDRVASD